MEFCVCLEGQADLVVAASLIRKARVRFSLLGFRF